MASRSLKYRSGSMFGIVRQSSQPKELHAHIKAFLSRETNMMKLALSILLFPSALFGDAFTVGPLPAKDLSTKVLMAVPKEGKDIDEVTVSGEEVSQDLFTIGLGDHGVVTVDGYKPDDFIAQAFDPELSYSVTWTLGLGDMGTLSFPGTFVLAADDTGIDDSFTIGLGDKGTLHFPKSMEGLFGFGLYTIGLGDYGTLTLNSPEKTELSP